MSAPLHHLSEVEELLSELPRPAEGFVRTFRGQTADFPSMLPSGCRPGAPTTGRIWDFALMAVHDRPSGPGDSPPTMDLVMNVAFWHKVLAQHYGPGSPFLDVTTSPEVALWFALNRAEGGSPPRNVALPRPGIGPVPVECPTLTFSPHRDEPGWLYVLDVPRWDGEVTPGHGELVDLSDGPPFVADCPRVRRQQGALVKGDPDVGGGDLSGCYACPPIAVERPFRGTPFVDRAPAHLFPDPDEDDWYARLLSAPLVPRPANETGFKYEQSLQVYVLTSRGTSDEVLAILEPQIEGVGLPARAGLRADPAALRGLRDSVGADPESATCVQLETPLLRSLPPVTRWNQNALLAGLGRRVQPEVESSGQSLPAVSLENVLVELSPLEHAFEDRDPRAPRPQALWLIRRGREFRAVVFQGSPGRGLLHVDGPHEIVFSAPPGRFELRRRGNRVPLVGSGFRGAELKVFFVTLDLLRGLSASVKPDAYPETVLGGRGRRRVVLPVRGVSTILTRTRSDPRDMRLHFLRYADTREPFAGPRADVMPRIATLLLETARPYEALGSLREIYGHVHEVQTRRRKFDLRPDREADGFSEVAAETLSRWFPAEPMGSGTGGES